MTWEEFTIDRANTYLIYKKRKKRRRSLYLVQEAKLC